MSDESKGCGMHRMSMSVLGIKRLNQSLRGWSCYFDYANNTKVFGDVKRHAEERLRTHTAGQASQGESPKSWAWQVSESSAV